MFKTKRASLVRRLWRSRVDSEGGRDGAGAEVREESEEQRGCGCLRSPSQEPRTPAQDQGLQLLRSLSEPGLDSLLRTVLSRGGDPGDCVPVPRPDLGSDPVFVMCRTFRWSDLRREERLKPLSFCHSHGSAPQAVCASGSAPGSTVCVNPHHYSRLQQTDSASVAVETRPGPGPEPGPEPRPQPQATVDDSDPGSSLGSSSGSLRSHWCSVAYWEQRTRLGRLYSAHDPTLCIFYHLPQGSGLCLGQLQTNAYHRGEQPPGGTSPREQPPGGTSAAQQNRRKIGFGIVLSQEVDGVWVYNRSQHSVFVHSPTLELPDARGLTVERVLPGYSLRVFDYERSSWMKQQGVKPDLQEGPWDPNSIRISFAKGWGPCYSRQFITSCPCWLEVLLNTHR